jgi:hypothetical protein
MSKSDSFFIRARLNVDNNNSFQQTSIDLGAYVDALGKSVLRIHNIAVKYADSINGVVNTSPNSNATANFQITTQSQTGLVSLEEKSTIATGQLIVFNDTAVVGVPSSTTDAFDMSPQHWTNGYLVGVEQIYLGGAASTGFAEDVYVSVVMECTVETLSQSAAMALALSQQ